MMARFVNTMSMMMTVIMIMEDHTHCPAHCCVYSI